MRYLPVNWDLKGKRAVVIGQGEMAEKKVQLLKKAGARVVWKKKYRSGDLKGACVAVAVLPERDVPKIQQEAAKFHVWLNTVDGPFTCDFTFPALVQRGEFLIAVSTGGTSPALARKIREDLEKEFGPEYAVFANLMKALRQPVKKQRGKEADKIFNQFIRSPVLQWIREKKMDEINDLIRQFFGPGYSLRRLGIKW